MFRVDKRMLLSSAVRRYFEDRFATRGVTPLCSHRAHSGDCSRPPTYASGLTIIRSFQCHKHSLIWQLAILGILSAPDNLICPFLRLKNYLPSVNYRSKAIVNRFFGI